MKKVLALVVLTLVAPFVSLLMCWTFGVLWSWFVAPSLGAGPSMAAWFGIGCIANIVLNTALITVTRQKVDADDQILTAFSRQLGVSLGCLAVTGGAWVTGQIIGWI